MVTKKYPDGTPTDPPHASDKAPKPTHSRVSTQKDQERALELVQEAMRHQMAAMQNQMADELDEAIRLYKESIALCPTADAHTYLGWAYSFQGRIDEAIAQCEIAIRLDPEFGNPYNDIGVYLMQQQKFDEAIPWLEKAKTAKRYEPRHFPFMNLGRVYVVKGMINKALEEFRRAMELDPGNTDLAEVIEQLESKLQ
jgi:Tfp pilus assembly protein PilF